MSADALLEIPAGNQFLNHVGTVHASAQLALAEATSGEFLLHTFSDEPGLLPLVRRMDAKFRKPAIGCIFGKINPATASSEHALEQLRTKGRTLLTILVDIYDEQGSHTLSSSFEWFIAKES